MEQKTAINKAKNFFEYLLALNNLVGKVTRDYREFEKTWFVHDLEELTGCFLFEDCHEEGSYFEIHRPEITVGEKQYPKPPSLIREWIKVDYTNEKTRLVMPTERKISLEDGEKELTEKFSNKYERVKAFQDWEREWNEWAEL